MEISKKQKKIFSFLVVIHIALVILMIAGAFKNVFNDSSDLRKGKACDFFAVYQAGSNIREGKSLYLDNEGESTPYSYPFRYLPFIGYTIGILISFFKPFTAYYLWISFYEFLLAVNIYITKKLTHNFGTFILASIPWLVFSPYLLEIHMGQWSFLLASILFYTIYGFLKGSKLSILFTLAPLLKPNALIIVPLLLKNKKYLLLILTSLGIAISSIGYFWYFREDVSVFMNNFKDTLYSHGGNLGFKSLYYLVFVKYLPIWKPRLWFLGFLVILGILNLYLTLKSKSSVLSFVLWICYYFLIYKDVWEHHYVLMMPVFALIISNWHVNLKELISGKYLPVVISFILIALPAPFILHFLFVENAPVEVDTISPVFVIVYHSIKISGIVLLYMWTVRRLLIRNKHSIL